MKISAFLLQPVPDIRTGWFRGTDKRAHRTCRPPAARWRPHRQPWPERNSRASSTSINAGGFDLDVSKSGALKFAAIVIFFESARDASDPQQHTLANLGQHFAASHNVGDGEATSWFQHAKRFAEHAVFVRERLITQFEMTTSTELSGSGMCSISPFKNSTLSSSGLLSCSRSRAPAFHRSYRGRTPCRSGRRALRRAARRCHRPSRGRDTVSPGFSFASAVGFPQPSEAEHCLCGNFAGLRGVVKIRRDRIAAAVRRWRCSATRAAAGRDAQGSSAVLFFHDVPDVWIAHGSSYLQI